MFAPASESGSRAVSTAPGPKTDGAPACRGRARGRGVRAGAPRASRARHRSRSSDRRVTSGVNGHSMPPLRRQCRVERTSTMLQRATSSVAATGRTDHGPAGERSHANLAATGTGAPAPGRGVADRDRLLAVDHGPVRPSDRVRHRRRRPRDADVAVAVEQDQAAVAAVALAARARPSARPPPARARRRAFSTVQNAAHARANASPSPVHEQAACSSA